tara:strand:+ start:59 stop:262 length:204 start_codon:yes stop_codon:yes gene_type:complete
MSTLNSKSGSNNWENDPNVLEFLERIDKPGPWSEEDDKIETVGGLSNDKERSFIKFINKLDKKNKNG